MMSAKTAFVLLGAALLLLAPGAQAKVRVCFSDAECWMAEAVPVGGHCVLAVPAGRRVPSVAADPAFEQQGPLLILATSSPCETAATRDIPWPRPAAGNAPSIGKVLVGTTGGIPFRVGVLPPAPRDNCSGDARAVLVAPSARIPDEALPLFTPEGDLAGVRVCAGSLPDGTAYEAVLPWQVLREATVRLERRISLRDAAYRFLSAGQPIGLRCEGPAGRQDTQGIVVADGGLFVARLADGTADAGTVCRTGQYAESARHEQVGPATIGRLAYPSWERGPRPQGSLIGASPAGGQDTVGPPPGLEPGQTVHVPVRRADEVVTVAAPVASVAAAATGCPAVFLPPAPELPDMGPVLADDGRLLGLAVRDGDARTGRLRVLPVCEIERLARDIPHVEPAFTVAEDDPALVRALGVAQQFTPAVARAVVELRTEAPDASYLGLLIAPRTVLVERLTLAPATKVLARSPARKDGTWVEAVGRLDPCANLPYTEHKDCQHNTLGRGFTILRLARTPQGARPFSLLNRDPSWGHAASEWDFIPVVDAAGQVMVVPYSAAAETQFALALPTDGGPRGWRIPAGLPMLNAAGQVQRVTASCELPREAHLTVAARPGRRALTMTGACRRPDVLYAQDELEALVSGRVAKAPLAGAGPGGAADTGFWRFQAIAEATVVGAGEEALKLAGPVAGARLVPRATFWASIEHGSLIGRRLHLKGWRDLVPALLFGNQVSLDFPVGWSAVRGQPGGMLSAGVAPTFEFGPVFKGLYLPTFGTVILPGIGFDIVGLASETPISDIYLEVGRLHFTYFVAHRVGIRAGFSIRMAFPVSGTYGGNSFGCAGSLGLVFR